MKQRTRGRFNYDRESPYFALNQETGDVMWATTPRHAVALAKSKNKLTPGRANWKWHACMHEKGNFIMLDMSLMYP